MNSHEYLERQAEKLFEPLRRRLLENWRIVILEGRGTEYEAILREDLYHLLGLSQAASPRVFR
jgi:hypothetical protein